MKTKHILSLILCALMLIGGVSCSEKQIDTAASSSEADSESRLESSTELTYIDNIPEGTTFNGEKIRFLCTRDHDAIYFDEKKGDVSEAFNEAVWKRNNLLEDRLEIKIAEPISTTSSLIKNIVRNSVSAGSDDYDVMVGHARFNMELLLSNVLYCLDNLNYIDLDQDYWSSGFNDNIALNGKHFWAVGDLSKYYISSTYALFVNSQLWNDYFSDINIYDTVREGKWTLDRMTEYSETVYVDENGNGERDNEDKYGFATNISHAFNGMFFASNIQYTSWDSNGTPNIAINNEHTFNVFDKIHYLIYNAAGTYLMSDEEEGNGIDINMFVTDRTLFMLGAFGTLENDSIRAMETDFYTIPMPKYDEAQENYRTSQHDGTAIYGVLNTIPEKRLDAVSATIEAMSSMASQMVTSVYYDDILKSKFSRDQDTAEMIDIIRSSLETDFVLSWSDSLKTASIFSVLTNNIQRDSISSIIAKSEKVWVKDLAALVEQLKEIAEQYE